MTDRNSELFELSMSDKAKPAGWRGVKHLEGECRPVRDDSKALNATRRPLDVASRQLS